MSVYGEHLIKCTLIYYLLSFYDIVTCRIIYSVDDGVNHQDWKIVSLLLAFHMTNTDIPNLRIYIGPVLIMRQIFHERIKLTLGVCSTTRINTVHSLAN